MGFAAIQKHEFAVTVSNFTSVSDKQEQSESLNCAYYIRLHHKLTITLFFPPSLSLSTNSA